MSTVLQPKHMHIYMYMHVYVEFILQESEYEWGNPLSVLPSISTSVVPYAMAAHRRRLQVQQVILTPALVPGLNYMCE